MRLFLGSLDPYRQCSRMKIIFKCVEQRRDHEGRPLNPVFLKSLDIFIFKQSAFASSSRTMEGRL